MIDDASEIDAPSPATAAPATNLFASRDVEEILRERGWLIKDVSAAATEAAIDAAAVARASWLEEAAALLGPQAKSREELADLLALIFTYDATATLASPDSQAVILRTGTREVIRALAKITLHGEDIGSARYKEIIELLKTMTRYRSRELFHPIRLALAGRAGEREFDRVILLLDSAAKLNFAVHVKGTRERTLEFCAALD
jgi:hypothetical protein